MTLEIKHFLCYLCDARLKMQEYDEDSISRHLFTCDGKYSLLIEKYKLKLCVATPALVNAPRATFHPLFIFLSFTCCNSKLEHVPEQDHELCVSDVVSAMQHGQ